jgi:hypothetical protein
LACIYCLTDRCIAAACLSCPLFNSENLRGPLPQSMAGAGAAPSEAQQREAARAIATDSASVDKDLLGPLMDPFLAGVLKKLCESGLQMQLAAGLLQRLCGSCCGKSATLG